ncbi:unnamed protein product [Coccothraustes coccothraustes]
MKELKGRSVQLRHSLAAEAVPPQPVVQGEEEPAAGAMEPAGRKRVVARLAAVERRAGLAGRAKRFVEQGRPGSAIGERLAEKKTHPLLLAEQRRISPAAEAGPTVAEAHQLLLAEQGKSELLVVSGTLPMPPAELEGPKASRMAAGGRSSNSDRDVATEVGGGGIAGEGYFGFI